jgi:hypothetical protein
LQRVGMELDEAEVGCEMEKMEKKHERPGLINFFWSWMVSNIMSIFHIHGWICSSLVKQTTVRMEQLRS